MIMSTGLQKGKRDQKIRQNRTGQKAGMTEKKQERKQQNRNHGLKNLLRHGSGSADLVQKERPVGKDYIDILFEDFVELHGDRYYRDDPAIIGGIAYFQGICVTVIAQAKGRTTKENLERNFAMPSPEGYRKARRLMKQAEKIPSSGHQFCRYSGCILRNGGGKNAGKEKQSQEIYLNCPD